MEFFTIGVYNSNESNFFQKLIEAEIDTFCDIRQRRGVRGSKYTFVNSQRLQQRLAEFGVGYVHEKGLAPPKEIRELQKTHDMKSGQVKRQRTRLGPVFCREYENQIINNFDFEDFFRNLERKLAKRVALFCVEEQPLACHRSMVAAEIQDRIGSFVKEL